MPQIPVTIDPDLVEVLPLLAPKRKGQWYKGMPSPRKTAREKKQRELATLGKRIGVAEPGQRAIYLLEKYGVKKILEFYQTIRDGGQPPVSSPDMLIVGRIARAFFDGDELDRLYNRSFGKVPDRSLNMNINLDATPEQLSERALELLARVNPSD